MGVRRLFVALDLPEALRERLAALRIDLAGARWTRPEQAHLTLRFLGDVEAARVPALKAALAGIRARPFELRLGGPGAFPNLRRPRVLVVRVEPDDGLGALQRDVEAAVQSAIGAEPEDRPFRPHVTLARLKDADARAVLAFTRANAGFAAAFGVDAFHLYASTLRPEGSLHERLASFPFAG